MIKASLDTSSSRASFALEQNGKILVEDFKDCPRGVSSLLPWIIQLVEDQKLTVNDIQQWTVGIGPGSFTGLRVGISFTKGICYNSQAQFRGFNSGYALLQSTEKLDNYEKIAVLHDGRKEEFLVNTFEKKNGLWQNTSVEVVAIKDLDANSFEQAITIMPETLFEENPSVKGKTQFKTEIPAKHFFKEDTWPADLQAADDSCEPIYVRPPVFIEPQKIKDISNLLNL